MSKIALVAGACGLFAAGAADAARPVAVGNPAQVQRLMDCRSIAAADQRLACFDREAASMADAIQAKNLVFVDKEKARAAKRSLFGFSIPDFGGLFGGGDDDEVKQIESTVRSTGRNPDGGLVITLADGSVWSQTDDYPGLDPRPGKTAIVKRGSLGTFWLSIPGQSGIKVKRVG
jgi:hypothetical protein